MATLWCIDKQSTERSATVLMAEIDTYMSVTDGVVSIRMGEFDFLCDSLFGLIEHNYSIDQDTLYEEFKKSLSESFSEDKKLAEPKKLLKKFDKRCESLLSKKHDFVFISSISLQSVRPKNREVNGCLLKFHSVLPKKFRNARNQLLLVKNPIDVHVENKDYVFLELRLKAVNDLTAVDYALQALALYRGLVQLQITKTIRMSLGSSWEHKYPVDATLKLGNIHTIHGLDGAPARNGHWHEELPNVSTPAKIEDLAKVESRLTKMLRSIEKAPMEYRQFCIKLILTYVDALDTRDPEAKFLKLWLCLELATGADDAKHIIKRVAFFYSEREIVAAQLQALRAARNSHVHAGRKPPRLGLKNFQLSEFIETLIIFIVGNHFKFDKPAQWRDFMSTTTDAQSIEQQIERLNMVKKFTVPLAQHS